MALEVVCPSCGKSVQVNDAAARRGKCDSCGEVFAIVQAARKVCSVCGTDVGGKKRTKDAQGNYYCQSCWESRESPAQVEVLANEAQTQGADMAWDELQQIAAAVSERDSNEPSLVCCSVCRRQFPFTDIHAKDGRPICVECLLDTGVPSDSNHKVQFGCSVCRRLFTAAEVYNLDGTFLCHSCYARHKSRSQRTSTHETGGGLGVTILLRDLFTNLRIPIPIAAVLLIALTVAAVAIGIREKPKRQYSSDETGVSRPALETPQPKAVPRQSNTATTPQPANPRHQEIVNLLLEYAREAEMYDLCVREEKAILRNIDVQADNLERSGAGVGQIHERVTAPGLANAEKVRQDGQKAGIRAKSLLEKIIAIDSREVASVGRDLLADPSVKAEHKRYLRRDIVDAR